MECVTKAKDGAEVLVEYCSGALSEVRAREMEQHIADCSGCRQLVESQRELWRTLDAWAAPEVSENFDARLYARIAQEQSAPPWKQWVRRIFEPAVPVAMWKPAVSLAAACAVLAVGLVVRTPAGSEQPKQIRAEQVDIEQVASALDDLDILTPHAAM
jgi:anti-sigma factor RsiW